MITTNSRHVSCLLPFECIQIAKSVDVRVAVRCWRATVSVNHILFTAIFDFDAFDAVVVANFERVRQF